MLVRCGFDNRSVPDTYMNTLVDIWVASVRYWLHGIRCPADNLNISTERSEVRIWGPLGTRVVILRPCVAIQPSSSGTTLLMRICSMENAWLDFFGPYYMYLLSPSGYLPPHSNLGLPSNIIHNIKSASAVERILQLQLRCNLATLLAYA